MTTSKSILTISTLAFALMFGGGIYVLTQLNVLAKPMVENIASEALGVKVSIGSLNISLPEKRVDVADIRIANPKGFSNPHAITVEKAEVTLEAIAENLIDFQAIAVNGPVVFLEIKDGTTNLNELKKGLRASAEASGKGQEIKVIIRHFGMGSAELRPSVTLIKDQELEPAKVSPVMLSNIGVQENGISAHDATVRITKALLHSYSKEAGRAGFYKGLSPEALKEIGQSQLDAVVNEIRGEVDKIGDNLKEFFE